MATPEKDLAQRQKLYSLGFSSRVLIKQIKTEFSDWDLVKRNDGESSYGLALKYRSKCYTNVPRRHREGTTGNTVNRRRKNTDSVMTSESGRSSALSVTENLDNDSFFKENYDFDAEDPVEPPQYPHLVHVPGTYHQELYLKVCKQLGIPHSSMFYKQLTLDHINVRRHFLGPLGMKACATTLMDMFSIHTIDLTENNLGPQGAQYVMELLSENSFIKHLILADNNLGSEGVSHISKVLQKTDQIITLNISGNGLGDELDSVSPMITETSHMTTLDISHNNIGDIGSKLLSEALVFTDTLQNLDISWNKLRQKGITRISEAIAKNSSLVYLNLSWNGVDVEGCSSLGKALEKNNSIEKLDISYNRIDGRGLDKLIRGLKKNTTLKTLRIGQNPLNQDDALAMLTFIQGSTTSGLNNVDMKDIDVEQIFIDLLDEVRAVKDITVKHGKTLGSNLRIQDYDEGCVLEYSSEIVFKQLGEILGVDVFNILNDVSEHLKSNLSVEQVIDSLGLLLNPLSTKCTTLLVRRLPKDDNGFINLRSEKVCQVQASRHHNHFMPNSSTSGMSDDEPEPEVDDIDPAETDEQKILRHLYKVFARKLASSTKYRRNLDTMSQNGERLLKLLIINHIENKNVK